jgi:hypothetical protein
MDHIDQHGGRFVTVLPRSRLEDAEFRKWVQSHTPAWEKVWSSPAIVDTSPLGRQGVHDAEESSAVPT